MFSLKILRSQPPKIIKRLYSDEKKPTFENPFLRTIRILKNDAKKLNPFKSENTIYQHANHESSSINDFPRFADVVIVGGGIMGTSIAYWLKEIGKDGLNVVVVEKDQTYKTASTVLSVGGLRQQFSLPENIQMSQYGAEFLRNAKQYLGEDIDLQFNPYGYLLLASSETAGQLEANYKIQQQHNVKNELLSQSALKKKFPWLNTNGIELGCLGLENEGWFDPWSLLNGFKKKAIEMGVQYVTGEVIGYGFEKPSDTYVSGVATGEYERLRSVQIKTEDGRIEDINFALTVIAAGPNSRKVAEFARIGKGKDFLSVPLPVEPRKRYVYCFNCQADNVPGINTPMTFDTSGTYFRREGLSNNFIAGRAPLPENEPSIDNLEVDHDFFESDIWPHLAERVPAFSGLKVNSSWAGFYEFNYYDENGIIGNHPYHANLFIATGFSGHGIQQAPAVGRAITELIIHGRYQTIDLTRLGFDRLMVDEPMYETNIF